jgi:uncharacterized protein
MASALIKKIRRVAIKRYSQEDFNYHILPVVKNVLLLAKRLHADSEVVEAAAYLHDIGRTGARENFVRDNEHHISGAEETRELLKGFGCNEEFIEKVAHCVLAHRGRMAVKRETLEAEIIACADAMAHFDAFLDVFHFFLVSCASFEEAVVEIEKKLQRNWEKKLTLPEAKRIVKPKFEAIMLLLNSMKEYVK